MPRCCTRLLAYIPKCEDAVSYQVLRLSRRPHKNVAASGNFQQLFTPHLPLVVSYTASCAPSLALHPLLRWHSARMSFGEKNVKDRTRLLIPPSLSHVVLYPGSHFDLGYQRDGLAVFGSRCSSGSVIVPSLSRRVVARVSRMRLCSSAGNSCMFIPSSCILHLSRIRPEVCSRDQCRSWQRPQRCPCGSFDRCGFCICQGIIMKLLEGQPASACLLFPERPYLSSRGH